MFSITLALCFLFVIASCDPIVHPQGEIKHELGRLKRALLDDPDTSVTDKVTIINGQHDEDLFEGDIVITEEDDVDTSEDGDVDGPLKNNVTKRNAMRARKKLWIAKIVPYEIDPILIREQAVNVINSAIAEFRKHTCLRWIPRTNEDNWVKFVKENGCWSSVGRNTWSKGFQKLSLGEGCRHKGVIMHEMMHAVGFWHEQSRPDRNQYVEVMWENIEQGKAHNFNKYSHGYIDRLKASYDFDSIMHYGRTAFSKNNKPTLQAVGAPDKHLGQRNGFSKTDILELNTIYDCQSSSGGWSSWGSYSPCDDTTCKKSRQRFCTSKNRAQDCPGADKYGIETNKTACPPKECYAPVNGHWGRWSAWGSCSTTCDLGKHSRTRLCDDPGSKYGGKNCTGLSKHSEICKRRSCNIGPDDCEFDADNTCFWNQPDSPKENSYRWYRQDKGTGSGGTGPSGDNSKGTNGTGFYMYAEASYPVVTGQTAKLLSKTFSATAGRCLKFDYHMYGSDMGTLNVYINQTSTGNKIKIFTESGDQGNQWKTGNATIRSHDVKYKVVFEAVRGNSYTSDIALDNLQFVETPCLIPMVTAPPPVITNRPTLATTNKPPATSLPPKTNKPTTNSPPTNKPITNPPPTNKPTTNLPPTNKPITNAPPTNKPITNPPPTNKPTTNLPPTNKPITNPPPTNKPITNPPPTNKPITNPPTTNKPTTNPPPKTKQPTTNLPPTNKPTTNPPPKTNQPTTNLPPTNKPTTNRPIVTSRPIPSASGGDCTFDKGFCSWTQDKTDTNPNDWQLQSGETPSYFTGPSNDHTTGKGIYIFVETSSPVKKGQTARLLSNEFLATPGRCMTFYYHMYGLSMGDFNIYLMNTNNGNTSRIFHRSGDKGNRWYRGMVAIIRNSNYKVMLESAAGYGYLSDIAVDDITFTNGPCPTPSQPPINTNPPTNPPTTYPPQTNKPSTYQPPIYTTSYPQVSSGDCNFDHGLCSWILDISGTNLNAWELKSGGTPSSNTGPPSDHTSGRGQYIFVETSSPVRKGQTARLLSDEFPATAGRCMSFYFHMYGTTMGTFNIYVEYSNTGNLRKVFTKSGNQGNQWHHGFATITSTYKYMVMLESVAGFSYLSDIAVDDITFTNGPCPTPSQPPINTNPPTNPPTTYPPQTNQPSTYQPPIYTTSYPQPCYDSNQYCSYWASTGECSKNPAYMLKYCKKSCNKCGSSCYDSNQYCSYWASIGECSKNPAYMVPNCKKSCNKCGSFSRGDCNFDHGLCSWILDYTGTSPYNWALTSINTPSHSTGPKKDHTSGKGQYIFVETSSPARKGETARLLSDEFPATAGRCMSFYYHMYGTTMGTFNIYVEYSNTGNLRKVFTKSGNQDKQWHHGFATITSKYKYMVLLESVRGDNYLSDIAVDDITFRDGKCP